MNAKRKTKYLTTAEACEMIGFSRQRFHVLKNRLGLVPWSEGNPKRVWWTVEQVRKVAESRRRNG